MRVIVFPKHRKMIEDLLRKLASRRSAASEGDAARLQLYLDINANCMEEGQNDGSAASFDKFKHRILPVLVRGQCCLDFAALHRMA